MTDRFQRLEILIGDDAIKKLSAARVAVFGIGGVGGHLAEALVRSGIGALDLIDDDTVNITNINRQLIALDSTVGAKKTHAARDRFFDINPNCKITVHNTFFTPETSDEFDFSVFSYVADAIDTVAGKIEIARKAMLSNTPVISSMGAGNKLDPTRFEVADIYKTDTCPLARVMRRELKKIGVERLKVVYSKEPAIKPINIQPLDNLHSKRQTPGSTAFTPPVAGLIMAGEIIKDLIKGAENE